MLLGFYQNIVAGFQSVARLLQGFCWWFPEVIARVLELVSRVLLGYSDWFPGCFSAISEVLWLVYRLL